MLANITFTAVLEANDLRRAVKKVAPVIKTKDSGRTYGALLEITATPGVSAARIVATDGHRLFVSGEGSLARATGKVSTEPTVLHVPGAWVLGLERVAKNVSHVKIEVGGGWVAAYAETAEVGKILETPFPQWQKVIPARQPRSAVLPYAEIPFGATKSSKGDSIYPDTVTVKIGKGDLVCFTHRDFNADKYTQEMVSGKVAHRHEKDRDVVQFGSTLDLRYWRDVVAGCKGLAQGNVVIEAAGEIDPITVYSDDGEFFSITMPVRI